jgi:regulatory protein
VLEITALTPSPRRKGRVHIYLDGKFLASVDAMTIAMYRLSVGQTMSPAVLADLERDAVLTRFVDRALRFLGFRPRSEAELRAYLRRQEATPEQVEAVLADLRRQKLVDDEAFAQFWRESRDRFSPRGEGALRSELRAKGVASDIVAEVMPDADEEDALAMRAAERQLRTIRALPWPDFRTKLLGYLQRRGFRYEVANRTARDLWATVQGEEIDDEESDTDDPDG